MLNVFPRFGDDLLEMKHLLLISILALSTLTSAVASTGPVVIFSQDVVAINADGSLFPSTRIEPQSMPGMQRHDYDLGRNRILRVETNIPDVEKRGLADLAATVRRCYSFIESTTGRQLERGILLFLVELEDIPRAYSFSASYDEDLLWSEVRLALIGRGEPLVGQNASPALAELLYDTLPHELGHDVLGGIQMLAQDVDGKASYHTRWFIEGVCEVLAKGFSRQEVPSLHRRYMAMRNIASIADDVQMQSSLLIWAQGNKNSLSRESELYAAALLAVKVWVESVSLAMLLDELESSAAPVHGEQLLVLLQKTVGMNMMQLIATARGRVEWIAPTGTLAYLVE